jgi:hypothetical protein
MKNSSDTIGNRTRDLPACSTVPQPNALPRAHLERPRLTIKVGAILLTALNEGFSVFFPSVVRQMPQYNSQRRGMASTVPEYGG